LGFELSERSLREFMSNCILVAAVQMVSGDRVDVNIKRAMHAMAQAARQGAQLVVLPEYFCLLSPDDRAKLDVAEPDSGGPIQSALSWAARQWGIWLVGGSLPLKSDDPNRVFNTQLVFDPTGQMVARYDKIHLFNFSSNQERFCESNAVKAGQEVKVVRATFDNGTSLHIGLSTCYDLRFPELYRAMGAVDLIVVPSAFTATTGQAHWETLLRARAIENQAYVLAAAQGGEHPGARQTWGHSMLIDPWGEIMAEMELGEGVLIGEVDLQRVAAVRESLPALNNRVIGLNE
jgi:nitrilase